MTYATKSKRWIVAINASIESRCTHRIKLPRFGNPPQKDSSIHLQNTDSAILDQIPLKIMW
jgi:hypothetical protein